MKHVRIIEIGKAEASVINNYLLNEPRNASECLGEDNVIVHTAVFDNGIEVDVKCCGVQYDEDADSNLAWTEAVLFDNGCECSCSDPDDEYFGVWQFNYFDDIYEVIVKEA